MDLVGNFRVIEITTSYMDPTETLRWSGYDENGLFIGTGTVMGWGGGGSTDYETHNIESNLAFRYLVLEPENNGDAYRFFRIKVSTGQAITESFTYEIQDSNNARDKATLTVYP